MKPGLRRGESNNYMRFVFLFAALAVSSLAQPISFSVKVGTPMTDFFEAVNTGNATYVGDTRRFLIGPSIELHVPLTGLSIEAEAIYRRVGYQYSFNSGASTTSGNSWQFPILLKKTLLPGPVKPFVDGGVTFQKVTGLTLSSLISTPITTTAENDFTTGVTFGVGVQVKVLHFRIEPELRYTRWTQDLFKNPVSAILSTNRNQGDFLVGFRF